MEQQQHLRGHGECFNRAGNSHSRRDLQYYLHGERRMRRNNHGTADTHGECAPCPFGDNGNHNRLPGLYHNPGQHCFGRDLEQQCHRDSHGECIHRCRNRCISRNNNHYLHGDQWFFMYKFNNHHGWRYGVADRPDFGHGQSHGCLRWFNIEPERHFGRQQHQLVHSANRRNLGRDKPQRV